ncbi:hypothetical protein [Saccharibacillus sp. JS10]|uniref:hypothetical protein n=1 Tax=Saccharibacillus sp. JS10 TaxID=2950552 RepID=UPI00210A35DF|nr:hypothetical protein [Saccharibacillus sp. JS10]MCQ4088387.1 hypothetical protein [Saccharibacillus sp. JS10]
MLQVSFLVFLLSSYVSVLGGLIALLFKEFLMFKIGFSGWIGSVTLFICSVWGLNIKAKKVLEQQYGMLPAKGIWRTSEYKIFQANLLKSYLKTHHLYTDEKIKLLIEGHEQELRQNKYPVLLNSGIVISLSVPLWIQYLTFLFKTVTTLEEATIIFMTGFLFVFAVIGMVGFTQYFLGELPDAFLFGERVHRKALIEHLQDARLRFQKEQPSLHEKPNSRNIRTVSPRIIGKRRNSRR